MLRQEICPGLVDHKIDFKKRAGSSTGSREPIYSKYKVGRESQSTPYVELSNSERGSSFREERQVCTKSNQKMVTKDSREGTDPRMCTYRCSQKKCFSAKDKPYATTWALPYTCRFRKPSCISRLRRRTARQHNAASRYYRPIRRWEYPLAQHKLPLRILALQSARD